MKKQQTFWVVKELNSGNYLQRTLRSGKGFSISSYMGEIDPKLWRGLYRVGVRCVKVRIVEVKCEAKKET